MYGNVLLYHIVREHYTQDIYNLMEVDELYLNYITLWNIYAIGEVEIQKRGAILLDWD